MVKNRNIGVIGIQGAISEHINTMKKALKETNTPGKVTDIKNKHQLDDIDALIIPGGESSTISKILFDSNFYDILSKKIRNENLPVMGTCAGCVLLASRINDKNDDVKLFNVMDMQISRNAFGRQRESFEKHINIDGFEQPYNAVFIRAPIIEKTWGKCKILSKIGEKIVMTRQGNLLALSFHPELTDDLRVHKYFLEML
jgi:5'-phosphate synthase pdxT subunit